jgi:hypothetical protein
MAEPNARAKPDRNRRLSSIAADRRQRRGAAGRRIRCHRPLPLVFAGIGLFLDLGEEGDPREKRIEVEKVRLTCGAHCYF